MTVAKIEHNLTEEELIKALTALAEQSEIGEELLKAVKARTSVDDTPKEPRHSALRHVYRLFMLEHVKAMQDIERYARELTDESIRKSQMAFDFSRPSPPSEPHHAAYDRIDPRTGRLEHIAAKGPQQRHIVPASSPTQEETPMNLKEQLEAYKPTLEEAYRQTVTSRLNHLKSQYGNDLRGKSDGNSLTNSKAYSAWERIRPLTNRAADGTVVLDPVAVTAGAEAYAAGTIEAWHGKITEKVQQLDNATVHHLDGNNFGITGYRDGQHVSIHQHMIINRSSQGTPFNQWPARIYVDGKATSEAEYKKLTGGDKAEQQAAEAKRQANMLPNGIFAKGDEVKIKRVRKSDGSKFEIYGKVTGQRDDKTIVRAGHNRFDMKDYIIETEKLERWNDKEITP